MVLASFMRGKGAQLRADFQQYYHLNLDDMGKLYSRRHAADLAIMLPSSSRVFVSADPQNIWTLTDRLLANIEYWTHVAVWKDSKDGQKNRNRPKHLLQDSAKPRLKDAVSLYEDDYAKILARPRRKERDGD